MEGNAQAMREALEQALYFLRRHHMGAVYAPDGETLIFCEDVIGVVDNALAAPPRNCDVGTAEEQAERFGRHCDTFTRDSLHCENCPCCGKIQFGRCEFAWAQLPYKANEGEAANV